MTTNTPRTDAALVDHMPSCSEWSQHYLDLSTFARKLERELNGEITNREKCCRDGNALSDELFDTQLKLKKAQAEVEGLKGIKQIKVSKRPYDYECGDGCCSEYGETWSVDGVEVAHGPCDDNRLQQLLKHLGYNARIVNENEDGEEIEDALATAPEEPAPQWRELGPDETIQEGDEVLIVSIIYQQSHRLTKCTGIKWSVDHITPVSKGGLHYPTNLQCLTFHANSTKRDKLPPPPERKLSAL